MKKSLLLVCLFLLLVAACVPNEATPEITQETTVATAEPEQPTPTPTSEPVNTGLTAEKLANSTYFAPFFERTIQLNQGEFSEEIESGRYVVTLLPQIAIGDLNGDQVDDAALLFSESSGGNGVFVSLIVISSNGGEYFQSGSVLIDDQPTIFSLAIENGEIILQARIHHLNDTTAVPTFTVERTYRMLENNLTLMAQNSAIPNSEIRSIIIDAPVNGAEVTNVMQITGSMPIAPFENNLRFAVYDLSGTLLYETGFMVSAEDMGTPAIFDNSVTVNGIESGMWVRLELSELSMADGSLVTSNSVVVKIK